MMMRMFRRVMGFRCHPMAQGFVDVFVRQPMADPLWQQRAGDHAEDADAQPDELRRHEPGRRRPARRRIRPLRLAAPPTLTRISTRIHDDRPPKMAASAPCVVARFQKAPKKSGTKAPASVIL